MSETAITELVDLNAQRVDGVGSPANGVPFLVIKAAADDPAEKAGKVNCKLCDGSGKIRGGQVDCPDCDATGKVTSEKADAQKASAEDAALEAAKAEADDIEKLVTGSDTTTGAAKGAVQDALGGQNGSDITVEGDIPSGQSGLAGPMVTGVAGEQGGGNSGPGSRLALQGGQSPYTIPAETAAIGSAFKAAAASRGLDLIAKHIDHLVKDGGAGLMDAPTGDAATAVSSMPWETYDAATLGQVASVLAMCNAAIDAIFKREQIEAATGDSGDSFDAWDLYGAQDAVDYATGIVARLTFVEQAAAMTASKTTNFEAAKSARDQLTALIADGELAIKARHEGSNPTMEDTMSLDVTKDELAGAIAEGSKAAVKAEMDAFKSALIGEITDLVKNANNNGENTDGDLKINGDIDDQLRPVAGGATKSDDTDPKGLAEMVKAAVQEAVAPKLDELDDRLTKMGKRASQGGPILDGRKRDGEGSAAKSETTELQRLEKAAEDAPVGSLAKARAEEDLTLARFRAHNEAHFGDFNPVTAA